MASPKMQELNASIPKGKQLYCLHTIDQCLICKKPLKDNGGIQIAHKECRRKLKHGS